MKPVLIVLNSNNPSRVHHLEKIATYRDRFHVVLIIDESSKIEGQSSYADEVIQFPMSDLENSYPALVARLERLGRPACALSLSEFLVPLQARLVETFGLLGPDRRMAEVGRRKDLMRAFCRDLGIPVPRYLRVSSSTLAQVKDFRFPVIVKPTMGGGSQMVQRCESWDELALLFPRMLETAKTLYRKEAIAAAEMRETGETPFVVEELIGGEVGYPTLLPYSIGEISVESVYFDGEVKVLAIHDKPLPNNGPYYEEFVYSTPTRISPERQRKAADYVGRIHRGLGRGAVVLHTEFRTMADDLTIVEFGVRMGGAAIYRSVLHSTGVDMIDALIAIGSGKKPAVEKSKEIPTVSHTLWAEATGTLKRVHGEEDARRNPYYLEHLIFDAPGTKIYRAPLGTRAHGHLVFQGGDGFPAVERALLLSLDQLWIEIEDHPAKKPGINRF